MICKRRNPLPLLVLPLLLLAGCRPAGHAGAPGDGQRLSNHLLTTAEKIAEGARGEVQRGVVYDARYVSVAYPGGDVPADRGACTDVIVRGLRHAGYDLQRLIHEDMRRHFRLYPQKYGLSGPDPNIDHRRVSNHLVFMRRHGTELPTGISGPDAATWQPGDLVYCELPGGILHCGVVSDQRNRRGLPLVIHNCSRAAEEDVLPAWHIVGHFRYPSAHDTAHRTGRSPRPRHPA